jgi:O-acetylhomoserine/O-acetylserine sulfhydrylase-like pyridoxal-dependent enzyme
MNTIALFLAACLPHIGQCKSIVQHPAPATDRECKERAAMLQQTLAGTIDDAGYRSI